MVMAHAGGWDEFFYFVVPIVIALLAIRWANRRAKSAAGGDTEARSGSWLSGHDPESTKSVDPAD